MEKGMQKQYDHLARVRRSIFAELACDLAGVVLIGWFIGNFVGQLKYLVPAIALDVYAIALVVAVARQSSVLGAVDFGGAVLCVQQRLQKLRLLRIRTTLGTLLFAPLMWLPLLIVGARGVFGIDVYAAGVAWLAANVLFGLAVIPIAVFFARRYGSRLQQSSALRLLADGIAGRSLMAALRDLQQVRDFAA
jgi:hypothetical protein